MGKGGVKRGVVDIEDLCATHRFDDEEVPELRRFMALHDFLGTVDPYGELPKTLA